MSPNSLRIIAPVTGPIPGIEVIGELKALSRSFSSRHPAHSYKPVKQRRHSNVRR